MLIRTFSATLQGLKALPIEIEADSIGHDLTYGTASYVRLGAPDVSELMEGELV